MLSISSDDAVVAAAGRAHSILAAAYFLPPGPVLHALEDAARRGCRVQVRLEARPYGDSTGRLAALNLSAVNTLRALGADAALSDAGDGAGPAMHAKAVICDGVAYLDDRNWAKNGADTVLRDDSRSHIHALEAAMAGRHPPGSARFFTSKSQALAGEAHLLARPRVKAVDVETESFSARGRLYDLMLRLAARGVRCRLLVSRALDASATGALATLAAAGVAVRAGASNEKIALTDGRAAWVGSANATSTYRDGNQVDWGVRTGAPRIVQALRAHFEAHWDEAAPVAPSAEATEERRSAPAIMRLPHLAGGEASQRPAGRSMLNALHPGLALDVLLEHRERSVAATDDAIRATPELAAPPLCQVAEDSVEPRQNRRVDRAATVFRDENSMQMEAENTMVKRLHLLFGWHNEGRP